ncbi:MAG TPA: glycosyltransferase family 1 protein [Segetibacter sp.]|jgi:glycosyltransferase involved in cell wall biosynthesis
MELVFFAHPRFLNSTSMPRFLNMLTAGFKERGHTVDVLMPQASFYNLPVPQQFKKWLGYIDQYILFPIKSRKVLKKYGANTLFIFTDNALGPWVPLVCNKLHVIHCHDFMAQSSAISEIPENRTGWTGKKYQEYIRRGYSKGKNFISVSAKTRNDLHKFLSAPPVLSEVVYNGLNFSYQPIPALVARDIMGKKTGLDLADGYLLHVGGNQWYKNRRGVIEIYNAWRKMANRKIPLILIGETPNANIENTKSNSAYKEDIHFISNCNNNEVNHAYSGALIFLFPSLAEGFGWPIAEAMACGCPVITTNVAPMTEVAGNAGALISRMPYDEQKLFSWALEGAIATEKILSLSEPERSDLIAKGYLNAQRFDADKALDAIEKIYRNIVEGIGI